MLKRLDNYTTAAFLPLAAVTKGNKESSRAEQHQKSAGLRDQYAPPGGLTRALNITYLRPLPLPSTIRIKVMIVQHGRSMSLVRGNIVSRDGQKIYFTCEHHKFNPQGTDRAARDSDEVIGKAKL